MDEFDIDLEIAYTPQVCLEFLEKYTKILEEKPNGENSVCMRIFAQRTKRIFYETKDLPRCSLPQEAITHYLQLCERGIKIQQILGEPLQYFPSLKENSDLVRKLLEPS